VNWNTIVCVINSTLLDHHMQNKVKQQTLKKPEAEGTDTHTKNNQGTDRNSTAQ